MDETTIRYILLFVGAIIILGILWDGLRRKKHLQYQETPPLDDHDGHDDSSENLSTEIPDIESDEPGLDESALDNIAQNEFLNDLPDASLDRFEIQNEDEDEQIETGDIEDEMEEEMENSDGEITSDEVASEIEDDSEEREEEELAEEEHQSQEETVEQEQEQEQEEEEEVESKNEMALSLEAETIPEFQKESYIRPDKYIMLHVMAPEGKTFGGYDLLQTILSHDLRYGDMQIFHKFTDGSISQQKKIFSLASATEPGDFNLNRIGGFSCKGLVLFMNIKDQVEPVSAFDTMFSIATQLADDLHGELLLRDSGSYTTSTISMIREELTKYIPTMNQN